MTNLELYKKLNFPDEVIEKLTTYEKNRINDIPKHLAQKLLNRTHSETRLLVYAIEIIS